MNERLTEFKNNSYSYYLKDGVDFYDTIQQLGTYEEAQQNRYELEISELNISAQTYKKFHKLNPDIHYVYELTNEHLNKLSPERCKEFLLAIVELGLLKI